MSWERQDVGYWPNSDYDKKIPFTAALIVHLTPLWTASFPSVSPRNHSAHPESLKAAEMYYLTSYGVPIGNINDYNWFGIMDISVRSDGDLIDKKDT